MPVSDTTLPWTDWYRHNRKRWPMTIGLWLGMAFTIYSIAIGYGYRLAQERLPVTRAAVIARNQPPVPDDRNAAALYDQATNALVPWKKLAPPQEFPSTFEEQEQQKPQDPDRLRSENWRDETTFATNGPLRTFIRANTEATRLTLDGMARPDIDWAIAAEDFPKAPITRMSNLRPLVRLVSQRALVAAQDGDWPTFITHLEAMERAADHARRGVGVMSYLLGTSFAAQTWTTASHSLALPGSTPDERTLIAMRALSLESAKSHLAALHRAFVDEGLTCGHLMDQVGCGDFRGISERISKTGMQVMPRPVSVYSAFYPWDRSAFDDLMLGQQEGLLANLENRSPNRPVLDPERIFFTDPRLVYSHVFGLSVSGMLAPVFGMIAGMERDRQCKWRMFTAAIDLRLWIQRNGRVPTTFDEAGIDPASLQDPFTKDQRLQLRRDDDGLVRLWSVGKNRKDDTTVPPTGMYARSDDVTIFIRLPTRAP